jgi:hypothetical protein
MSRHFANWLDAYVEYCSHLEAPDYMHWWSGVSTIAGALGRNVKIDMGGFNWYPNHYIILVGPPDVVAKSTTVGRGMDLLRAAMKNRQVNGFGPNACSWQALVKSIQQATNADGFSALTVSASELGVFFKTDDADMMDILITLWDGSILHKEQMKESSSMLVEKPLLNFNGCTTPSWVTRAVPIHMKEGGLMSRIILVYAERKAKLVSYPGLVVPVNHADVRGRLIADLESMMLLKGKYRLSGAAVKLGTEWYENLYSKMLKHDDWVLTRRQTHVHKLAIVIAASKRDELVIEAEDLQQALDQLGPLDAYRRRVMESIGSNIHTEIASKLVDYLMVEGTANLSTVYELFHRDCPSKKAFFDLVDGCEAAGYIKAITQKDKYDNDHITLQFLHGRHGEAPAAPTNVKSIRKVD